MYSTPFKISINASSIDSSSIDRWSSEPLSPAEIVLFENVASHNEAILSPTKTNNDIQIFDAIGSPCKSFQCLDAEKNEIVTTPSNQEINLCPIKIENKSDAEIANIKNLNLNLKEMKYNSKSADYFLFLMSSRLAISKLDKYHSESESESSNSSNFGSECCESTCDTLNTISSFRRTTVSSRLKMSSPKVIKNEKRFSFNSENTGLITSKQMQKLLNLKKKKRISRMNSAKDFSSKLNRYSAKYFTKQDRENDLDIVAIIEEKIISVMKGYIVRWKIERQKRACLTIQRWIRDVIPVRQQWNAYWRKEKARRLVLYTQTQIQLKTLVPQAELQQDVQKIVQTQNIIRTRLMELESIKTYNHIATQTQLISNQLFGLYEKEIHSFNLSQIQFVQRIIKNSIIEVETEVPTQPIEPPKKKKKKGLFSGCSIM